MTELFTSAQFWGGALLLLCFQIGKYSELNLGDESLRKWVRLFPNLSTRHFLNLKAYLATLALFLLATFAGYLVACLVSPTLIAGWLRVTMATTDAAAIESYVKSVPYPLFISAAFMGLAHQTVPGFSKIANLQRDVFHELVGVPSTVADTATDYSIQELSKLTSDEALRERLTFLTSVAWRNRLRRYADINFYDAEVLRHDDGTISLAEMPKSALRDRLEQLIFIASIAAVRENGGKALRNLAQELNVEVPPTPPPKGLVAGFLIAVVALTFVWFSIPFASPLVDLLNAGQPLKYWPVGENELRTSGIYLLAQTVPIIASTFTLIVLVSPVTNTMPRDVSLRSIFESYAIVLLSIVLLVVVFDYAQIIADYGIYSTHITSTPFGFFLKWAPYNLLHATISLFVCVILLTYIARGEAKTPGVSALYTAVVALGALVPSLFYSAVRLRYDFKEAITTIDYLLIICLLNVVGAVISLYLVQSICHHQVLRAKPIRSVVNGVPQAAQ